MAEYSFFTFDSKGRLDASEREKTTRLVMDTLEPIVPEEKPGKVIDVRHRFAKKRWLNRHSSGSIQDVVFPVYSTDG